MTRVCPADTYWQCIQMFVLIPTSAPAVQR